MLHYNAARVTDLNGTGYGGVPGIFRALAEEAGLQVDVASELMSGQTLRFHLDEKRALITSRPWDVVVLQEYSTLSPRRPGDATAFVAAAGALESAVHAVNPGARVYLLQTWARADQVYQTPGGRWSGQSLEELYGSLARGKTQTMAALFVAAMREWKRSFEGQSRSFAGLQMRIEKVMDVTISREVERLERRLTFLATVGSTSTRSASSGSMSAMICGVA